MSMIELDPQLQDQINASADRYYWQIRLERGAWVPTRQLVRMAREAIEEFNAAGIHEHPKTDMHNYIDAADARLERERGKLWKLMEQEEANR